MLLEHAYHALPSILIAMPAIMSQLLPAVAAAVDTISMVMLAALVLLTVRFVQMARLVPPVQQEVTTLEVPVLHAPV